MTTSRTAELDLSSSLSLVFRSDELFVCSGDTGAVGRIAVGSKKKGRGLVFDLKGRVCDVQEVNKAVLYLVFLLGVEESSVYRSRKAMAREKGDTFITLSYTLSLAGGSTTRTSTLSTHLDAL